MSRERGQRAVSAARRTPDPQETWSIGIYSGPSPLQLRAAREIRNPVLCGGDVTDMRASFVADPFMVFKDGQGYMFFEAFDARAGKGAIGLAESGDGLSWDYRRLVLEEDFHLSYPFVFEWNDDFYMIPETLAPKSIRLYRAAPFPYAWTCVGNLIEERGADPTLLRHSGLWWLFTCSTPYRHDTLRLYLADQLMGPWREHPCSPILSGDRRRARPGGRPIRWDGRLLRFAQDCSPSYGSALRAFEIVELSPDRYSECEAPESPVLRPSTGGWNGGGMHHLDPHLAPSGQWIACVDGYRRTEADRG